MKLTLSSIKEFLDIDRSPEEIGDVLTLAGLEVDAIDKMGEDVQFEISLTPNLGHCMSALGVARELSAAYQIPLKIPDMPNLDFGEKTPFNVEFEAGENAPSYRALLVKNVKNGASPDWLVEQLEGFGIRNVNLIVDVGNLIMMKWGQPLHMFDADKLEGDKISLKLASAPGKMTTLDEVERNYPEGTLLVCDGEGPVAFAGVMGDLKTAVTETTQNVLIEAAYFSPEAIRFTSKRLGLRTDASSRFERGVDPTAADHLIQRAAAMLDGSPCAPSGKSAPFSPKKIRCRADRVNQLLGTHLTASEIASLLRRLEMEVSEDLVTSPPPYRHDIQEEIDLVEEVARLFGFNHIPRVAPRYTTSLLSDAPLHSFETRTRSLLCRQNLQEMLTCDLISEQQAQISHENALGDQALIRVLHPASKDQSVLRTSFLPGLLEVVRFNLDRQNADISGFEVGSIHFREKEALNENLACGIILTGNASPHHFANKDRKIDFFDLKGHVELFCETLGVDVGFSTSHLHSFHPGQQAQITLGKEIIGALGQVHPNLVKESGIDQPVYFAQLNLAALMHHALPLDKIAAVSTYPGSERDWTITLKKETPIGQVAQAIESSSTPLLVHFRLQSLYESEKIGKDRKNATFRFTYRDPSKTVSFEEVEKEHHQIILAVAKKLGDRVVLENDQS